MDVDVILTTHAGRHGWLTEAIDSILAQTYPTWHLTVIDDASPDDKAAFVRERYAEHGDRIRVVRLDQNQGPYGAKTAGIERTSREAMSFLDDDDRWHPEKLARQVERLAQAPQVHGVHTDVRYIDADGSVIPNVAESQNARRAAIDWDGMDEEAQARSLFGNYSMRSASTLVLRTAFERAGGFDDSLPGAADSEFWVRFVASGHRLGHIAVPLYDRRVHSSNNSSRDPVAVLPNRLRATEKLVTAFPYLEDLAKARKVRWVRTALRASLEQGDGATIRALARQLQELGGAGTEVTAAMVLSRIGPLRRPLMRARRAIRDGADT